MMMKCVFCWRKLSPLDYHGGTGRKERGKNLIWGDTYKNEQESGRDESVTSCLINFQVWITVWGALFTEASCFPPKNRRKGLCVAVSPSSHFLRAPENRRHVHCGEKDTTARMEGSVALVAVFMGWTLGRCVFTHFNPRNNVLCNWDVKKHCGKGEKKVFLQLWRSVLYKVQFSGEAIFNLIHLSAHIN